MKKTILLLSILFLCQDFQVYADYSLPDAEEQLVLLLNLSEIKIRKSGLVITDKGKEYIFRIDRFWMQDRIWSDGICVGVRDSDPKSSASRIREIQLAKTKKSDSQIIIELVRIKGTANFIVTYLKLFDPEIEFKKYFPKREYYDTVKLPFNIIPKTKEKFVTMLQKSTNTSMKRLTNDEGK